MKIVLRALAAGGAILALAGMASATDFYVAPSGSSSGDGSVNLPWDLATALAHPAAVRPGDTIWLRGGAYRGTFLSQLTGTAGAPIKVRQFAGERATIDGNVAGTVTTLGIRGAYTWYIGFEVTNSSGNRWSPSNANPDRLGFGIDVFGPNLKLINLVVHDTAQGIAVAAEATNTELYGNLVYSNGWNAPGNQQHGHGIYPQSQSGMVIKHNLLMNALTYGIHAYGSSSTSFRNARIEQNVAVRAGLLVGGNPGFSIEGTQVIDNWHWSTFLSAGYHSTLCSNLLVRGNYVDGTMVPGYEAACRSLERIESNTFYGGWDCDCPRTAFPNNTFLSARPTTDRVVVLPNSYEPGRATIAVFNGDRSPTQDLNLASVLPVGARYEIRDGQNFHGAPVASGTYSGGSVSVPMTGYGPAPGVGVAAPAPTGPDFNVFVVVPVTGSTVPPPTPNPTPPPTAPPPAPTPPPTAPPSGPTSPPTAPPSAPTPTPTPPPTLPPGYPTLPPTTPYLPPTAPPTPAPPGAGSQALTVPVAGHVIGVGGVVFMTDLHVENPTQSPAVANLSFLPAGSTTPSRVTLSLAPGQTLNYYDVIANRFGIYNAAGALRLETSGSLKMNSRTYARVGGGTFGQAVCGVPDSPGAGSLFVTGLVRSEEYRSNLGVVNPSGSHQRFEIRLYAPDGGILGVSAPVELPGGTQMQWALGDVFPSVYGKGLTVEFRPRDFSATPIAYAAVIDNASGDPTYYRATRPLQSIFLPGVARVTGVGLSFFSSDISFANVGDSPAQVTVTFLERDRDNLSGAPEVTFSLAPHQTRQLDDALSALFGLWQTYGALRISSDGAGLIVSERISTDSTTTLGTVGQQVDPVGPEGFMARGSILGLRQDAAFRSNVGLLNPNEQAVDVTLFLKAANGDLLSVTYVTLPPLSYVQRNIALLFPSVAFAPQQMYTLVADTGGPGIFSFANIVDNVSQDLTFSPGLP